MKRYLITSALPYASGITHLGNVVGSTLPADIYARYCRLAGRKTLYVCGSDEHGVAITIAAEKEGVSPQQLVDRYHHANATALQGAGIEFDIFGRTTDPLHKETAQDFFSEWMRKGLLVERDDDQFYDEQAQIFLPDRYVEGVCPNCGYDKARGDQCDSCGAYYNQLDLKQPRSVVSGHTPVVRKTKHWYFRLDAFQQWIHDYIEGHAAAWKDNVVQQSRSWVKQGLAERAATRDMKWGIPVPVPDADGKVLYVWFEAVLGYISATKQWAVQQGTPDAWKEWWQDPETIYTAFLGKDNIVFHTIIFPILLHSRSEEGYILPENVPANEFLNLEGQKFSKSRNWAIDLVQYLTEFQQPQHVDILRYVLTMNMPETKDSDFTWRDYQARTNNELAAILGNYVNRVLQFTHKNFDGKIPTSSKASPDEHEVVLRQAIAYGVDKVAQNLDAYRFRDAVTEAMNIARAANKYFNDKAPWKAIKENPEDAAHTLNVCIQTIRSLSIVFAPLLPHAVRSMQVALGEPAYAGEPRSFDHLEDIWTTAKDFVLPEGRVLTEPAILFTKVEDEMVQAKIAELGSGIQQQEEKETAPMNMITIDDFQKIQLRTAVVLEAERVEKSKKLIKLQVDLGTEKRQILAGIAQHYTPEQLVGKTIVVVANLQPATLMGHQSQGMVLAASNEQGELALVQPSAVVGPGAEVR